MQPLTLIGIDRTGAPLEPIATLPDLVDEVTTACVALYERVGHEPPWIGYLSLLSGTVIGTCGFTSPPINNEVEIAYFTFPEHEGQGYATSMARALVALARRSESNVGIIAHTLPEENASGTILNKLGFVNEGEIEHPEDGTIWRWRLA